MELKEATRMLQQDIHPFTTTEKWLDAGCGSGLFTLALATFLPGSSHIYAVDMNKNAMRNIPASYNHVYIEKKVHDFSEGALPYNMLNGILMANSLHYINDKKLFVQSIQQSLLNKHGFLIVEYDTDSPVNPWVPYPVSFNSLKKLFREAGYTSIYKINQTTSRYNKNGIYSAYITNTDE